MLSISSYSARSNGSIKISTSLYEGERSISETFHHPGGRILLQSKSLKDQNSSTLFLPPTLVTDNIILQCQAEEEMLYIWENAFRYSEKVCHRKINREECACTECTTRSMMNHRTTAISLVKSKSTF